MPFSAHIRPHAWGFGAHTFGDLDVLQTLTVFEQPQAWADRPRTSARRQREQTPLQHLGEWKLGTNPSVNCVDLSTT